MIAGRLITAAVLMLACGITVISGISQASAAADRAQGNATVQALNARASASETETAKLVAETRAVTQHVAAAQAVLNKRPAFLSAIADFRTAADAATGKVDIAAERAVVLAAQAAVVAERTNPASVDTQTKIVTDATAKVMAAVAAWQGAHQLPAPKKLPTTRRATPSAPASDWLAEARSILDQVGGTGIPLEAYDGHCGSKVAVGCSQAGIIKVAPTFASMSTSRKYWAMTHELAHQYQFRIMSQLRASATFGSLFGGNLELLANCQAADHGHPSAYQSCSSTQLSWAQNIWNGVVAN